MKNQKVKSRQISTLDFNVKVMQSYWNEVNRLMDADERIMVWNAGYSDGSTTVTFKIETSYTEDELRAIFEEWGWAEITLVKEE